ncbi:MAG TPA: hypothetical protein VHW67_13810 [Solirubrobacteraceae bacterium]|jgi:hypothetical protein|nr:hypothetical protein [Solirubrobacteraceae bacterium]
MGSSTQQQEPVEDAVDVEAETLPVLAEEARVVRAEAVSGEVLPARESAAMIPAVQAAAVAAGGFVAGAAVVGLVARRRRRSPALAKGRAGRRLARGRGRRGSSGAGELVQIVGSRSLLLDVHLLGGRD